ncbi:MAG: ArnT family glycosyltransferase [Bacteroidota bacterium]
MNWIILVIALIALVFSLHYIRQGKHKFALSLIILGGLFLRLFMIGDGYLHAWDERFHALVAKNLMDAPFEPMLYASPVLPFDPSNWTCNHIWLHKQPLSLWSMALSMTFFGINEIAVRLPSLIFSLLSILLIYEIAHYLFSRKVALLSAFFFSINGFLLELASGRTATDHVDIHFLFFILLTLYLGLKSIRLQNNFYWILSGVVLGLAVLTKWLPALLVLPLLFIVLQHQKKHQLLKNISRLILLSVIAALVSVPWQLYIHAAFPVEANWESFYNFKHLFVQLEGHQKPWYYFFIRISTHYGELIWGVILWFAYDGYRKKWPLRHRFLLCWFMLPFIFFTLAQTKMPAYMIIGAPPLFIMTGTALLRILDFLGSRNERHSIKRYATIILIIALIGLPLRYTFERVKPLEPSFSRTLPAIALLKKNSNHRDLHKKTVVLNYPYPIQGMFYTDAVFYDFGTDKPTIDSLKTQGYHVIDLENEQSLESLLEE